MPLKAMEAENIFEEHEISNIILKPEEQYLNEEPNIVPLIHETIFLEDIVHPNPSNVQEPAIFILTNEDLNEEPSIVPLIHESILLDMVNPKLRNVQEPAIIILSKEDLNTPSSIVASKFNLAHSTFSRIYKRTIRSIQELSDIPKKKRGKIWPCGLKKGDINHRVLEYAIKNNGIALVKVRKYKKPKKTPSDASPSSFN
ncbi:hypothetical protein CYY_005066 [Polysphondylium violaceum]|uniref:Uncharacterized protein n=1 Tax=Polysphondylium violaceum TaxID=133409 RepID=A0A8J4PVP7_9MYCE|nr:hypothetical protein CYY_005066 [Polysphondylium violaceum]